jgi:hypothetical protein
MGARIVKLSRPAEPNIHRVLGEFLDEQRERLRLRTLAQYEAVIDLLRSHLNGYAHQGLSKPEAARFDRAYNAKGEEHREFCDLFGPEKIVENLDGFLGYFMIRKVIAGEDLLRAAGTVSKKLSKWLAGKGYVTDEAAGEATETSAAAARDLPRAERAAHILRDAAERLGIDVAQLAGKDYLEFDHFTIARVEPGRLWLEVRVDRKMRVRGPISAPVPATRWLRPGWNHQLFPGPGKKVMAPSRSGERVPGMSE